MVGVAYNPDNCAFVFNQALNANQFNGSVNFSNNSSTHIVLWDFVEQKLYWVNSQTNIIDAEIGSGGNCKFKADINYVGTVPAVLGEVAPQAPSFYYRYTCVATNGVAPFTYQWSIKTGPFIANTIVGSSTSQNVDLEATGQFGSSISIIRCRVTDAEGCKTTAYFFAFVAPELG